MGTYRLYSGDDGQSHVEAIELAETPDWTNAQDVSTIRFSASAPGRHSDWHTAPRRQYVIILSGQLEIGLGDGSTHIFGPGDARLVEDTTGKGHTTGTHGDVPCVTCTGPLANQ